MPKGRLKRFNGLSDNIFEIVSGADEPISTDSVRHTLKHRGISATWSTVYSYLQILESEKKIKRIRLGKKINVSVWLV